MVKRTHGTVETTIEGKHKRRIVFGKTGHKKIPTSLVGNGAVNVGSGITLAMGYQSVRLDVGVTLPVTFQEGANPNETLRRSFDQAYEFLDEEIAERSKEVESLLKDLAKKYGH